MKKRRYFLVALSFMTQLVVTAQDVNIGGTLQNTDMPHGMTVEADSLLMDFENRSLLKERKDVVISDKPYDDKVLIDRIAHIPTTIEMPLNNITRQYIDQYCNKMRRSVSVMLGSSNFYMPFFEEALEKYGLPLELKYLPVVESALRPTAQSPAGAVGIWQFMLATGKGYGLEVNTLVDERRDPLKSSYAAAHYLSDLYNRFHDWGLAIAAYNCGENNVAKAILRAGNPEATDYWTVYNYLPKETRGYVPAFIAATYVMNYYCEHGIVPMEASMPIETDTVVVRKDVAFTNLSEFCKVSLDELRMLNPQYRRDIVPMDYSLRMPNHAIEAFVVNEDSIYTRSSSLRRETIEDIKDQTTVKKKTTTRRKSTRRRRRR